MGTVREYFIQEGMQREARLVARKLLNRGCSASYIREITDLTIQEIEELQVTDRIEVK